MALDIDRYHAVDSIINRWDPRVKIASLGILIFSIALLKTLPVAVMAILFTAVLIRMTALPWHFISHGLSFVLIFLAPFFLIMPITYPGEPAFTVLGLGFAWEGLRLASLIFVKAVTIVLVTYAVFGSSRFDVSMLALQHLKCPKVVVQMLLFTYRYTFVFLEEMRRMHTSMQARGFVARSNMRTMTVFGHFVGTLLIRSFERTERVYKAMLSKGYQGELYSMVTFHSESNDYVKAVIVVIVSAALVAADFSGKFPQAVQGWY
jgi:cobalt/nickel transport system permease protein